MEGKKIAASLLAATVGFGAQMQAAVSDSAPRPYQGIVERNVFGLRNPPQQKIDDPIPPPSMPKVILTGITTILGAPLALLKVQSPGSPGHPPSEQSYILTVGQKQGDIEVLNINDQAGTVQLNNAGNVTVLDINRDSPKPPPSPPPSPQQAAVANPAPVTNPAAVAPGPGPVASPPLPNAAQQQVPIRVPRTGAHAQPAPPPLPPVPPQQLTPEEQAVLQELERQTTNRGR
jgi:hypothetical protein